MYSFLASHCSKEVDQCSPVQSSFVRCVQYDENGTEVVTWREADYPSIQNANGLVTDWSLDALLKAGINPDFGIRTNSMSRLALESVAVGILDDVNSNFKSE